MTYRVIQWGTGAMGKTCLRGVIDHPDPSLAGLLVHSDRKAGKDAGEIAGREWTGIKATCSLEEVLAIEADVVLPSVGLPSRPIPPPEQFFIFHWA